MQPSSAKFYHPYEPYDIQLEFMQNLYACIENRQIGIFESPTGTGKSLSLICAALTWLRDDNDRSLNGTSTPGSNHDWLAEAERNLQRRALVESRQELEVKLKSIRDRERQVRQLDNSQFHVAKKPRHSQDVNEDDFVLEDYDSDQDTQRSGAADVQLSHATLALLEKLQPQKIGSDVHEPQDRIRIIFCSRTHSQLSQFTNELKKLHLAGTKEHPAETIKQIPLASRKTLCINHKVSRLPSTAAINERCLELQKPRQGKENKCEYLLNVQHRDGHDRNEAFKEHAIATIRDIEDIALLGRKMKICPYYASRNAIPAAEIVTVPYPLLLQRSAREALGIDIRENVVIIDEAHNLSDAIANAMSVAMPLSHMTLALAQLTGYCQNFRKRLKGKNRVYIALIMRLLRSCITFLQRQDVPVGQEVIVPVNQLVSGIGNDQIQPNKLVNYLRESKLVYKVEGYTELVGQGDLQNQPPQLVSQPRPKGVLATFSDLLVALMNPDAEGRFFLTRNGQDLILQYSLLDPEQHFREIAENARAVILAGGTMSPMSDYSDHLFSYIAPSRLKCYSFDHVIDKQNVLVEPVPFGVDGTEFDFTFANKNSERMIVELGLFIERLSQIVPGGLVVFFPSYDYLAHVTLTWRKVRQNQPIFSRIDCRKRIFEETKTTSTDDLLGLYASQIATGQGALLLAVVNGKLSEGINFSDALGRCVVCVGLPYPNVKSAQFTAKIEHISTRKYKDLLNQGIAEHISKSESEKAGRAYTDNVTMRAVNQCIGRAIRHKNDYAAIVLVDKRFATQRVQSRLPAWLRGSLSHRKQGEGIGACEDRVREFFSKHQDR